MLSEVSQKEKNNSRILTHIGGIWKKNWYGWSYLQSRNRDKDVENKHMDPNGERGRGWIGRLGLTYIHQHHFWKPSLFRHKIAPACNIRRRRLLPWLLESCSKAGILRGLSEFWGFTWVTEQKKPSLSHFLQSWSLSNCHIEKFVMIESQ